MYKTEARDRHKIELGNSRNDFQLIFPTEKRSRKQKKDTPARRNFLLLKQLLLCDIVTVIEGWIACVPTDTWITLNHPTRISCRVP